jgi:acyl carrier protein
VSPYPDVPKSPEERETPVENAPSIAQDVAESLRVELARALQSEPSEVDLGVRLTELPGMDSLRLVQLIGGIEQRWDVALDEEDLFDVRTGDDLCALIVTKAQA